MIQLQDRPPWEMTDETQPQLPTSGTLPPLATPAVSTSGNGNTTGTSGATGGTDTNPSIPTPGLTSPTIASPTSFSVPPKATDTTPGATTPDSVMGISALPDGAGGSVTVPPLSLAPSSVVPPAQGLTAAQQSAANAAAGQYRAVTPDSAAAENAARGIYPGLIIHPDGTRTLAPGFDQLSPEMQATARAHLGDTGYVLPNPNAGGSAPDSPENQAAELALMRAAGGPAYAPGSSLAVPGSPSDGTPSIPGAAASDLAPWEVPTGSAAPGTFDASNNLIASQVLPGNDPRLTSAQSLADAALAREANGPDRLALAKEYYDEMTAGANADYEHNLADATNMAGAHGQLHSGQLTNRYGDLFSDLTLRKDAAKRQLITSALEGTIGDTRNLVSDTGAAESRAYGEGAANRNETRTERGYEQDLATQALIERIQQQQAENAASQQAFENALRLYGVGSANNPELAYENAAAQATSEAGGQTADVGQLLALLAQRRAAQGAPTVGG